MERTIVVSTVSATEPDWSREAVETWWSPSRQLIRSIRRYQKWKKRGGLLGFQVNVFHNYPDRKGAKSGTKRPVGNGSPLTRAAKVIKKPWRKQLSHRGCLFVSLWTEAYCLDG